MVLKAPKAGTVKLVKVGWLESRPSRTLLCTVIWEVTYSGYLFRKDIANIYLSIRYIKTYIDI